MTEPLADTPLAPRFLVHAKWAETYYRKDLKTKVVNEPLVDHACGQILLRRGLSHGADFWVLDADMWVSLQRHYGSDYTLRRTCTAPPPPRVVVKGELAPVQRAKKPCPAPTAAARLELDVHPTMTKLYYWDDAKGGAVVCRHITCDHEVLVGFTPTSTSVATFMEIARGAILAPVAFDVTTHRQIVHYKADLLVWHFGWKMWVLWRASRDFKMPTDATALRSPASGSFRMYIRRKMDAEEVAAHLEVKKAKQAKKKKAIHHTKAPRSRRGEEQRRTARSVVARAESKRAGSKRALGKRRRHDNDNGDGDDDENESKESERDQADSTADSAGESDTVVEFGSSDESDAIVDAASPSVAADAEDSQSTVDTQPATTTAAAATGPASDATVGNDQSSRVSTPMLTLMETVMQALKQTQQAVAQMVAQQRKGDGHVGDHTASV